MSATDFEAKARALWGHVELVPMEDGRTKIAFGRTGREFQVIMDDRTSEQERARLTAPGELEMYQARLRVSAWFRVYRHHPEAEKA